MTDPVDDPVSAWMGKCQIWTHRDVLDMLGILPNSSIRMDQLNAILEWNLLFQNAEEMCEAYFSK